MTAAIFGVVGALIGVLGAFTIEWVRRRNESLRLRQDKLRLACADFAAAVTEMWQLAIELMTNPADSKLKNSFYEAHRKARMHYERLRLTAASGDVQESARFVLRYAYGMLREIEGKPLRDDERERGPLTRFRE